MGTRDPDPQLFIVPAAVQTKRGAGPTAEGVFKQSLKNARAFHGWTIDKLEVFRIYLTMFKRIARRATYIDGFAGSGMVEINGQKHRGSARLAMEEGGFQRILLFETQEMMQVLEHNIRYQYPARRLRRVSFHPGDCNIEIRRVLDQELIDRDHAVFAMLDPDSTQLAWLTVRALAEYKTLDLTCKPPKCKIELWILFNTTQLRRLWPSDRTKYPEPPNAHVLDRVMGGADAWRDLWDQGAKAFELLLRYVDRLRDLGYVYVSPYAIRDPVSRRAQYYMIHATDHGGAVNLMKWASGLSTELVVRPTPLFPDIEVGPSSKRRRT